MRVRMERPLSEQLVDLHVYIVPPDLWQDQLHSASNEIISETVSAGFLRILPETTVHCLRDEIPKQIGLELIPAEYVFLKSVGRCLTRVKAKQEHQMKVKHFLPPHAYCPEIFLLEPTAAMKGMLSSDDESSRVSYDYHSSSQEQNATDASYAKQSERDHYQPAYSKPAETTTSPSKYSHGNNQDSGFGRDSEHVVERDKAQDRSSLRDTAASLEQIVNKTSDTPKQSPKSRRSSRDGGTTGRGSYQQSRKTSVASVTSDRKTSVVSVTTDRSSKRRTSRAKSDTHKSVVENANEANGSVGVVTPNGKVTESPPNNSPNGEAALVDQLQEETDGISEKKELSGEYVLRQKTPSTEGPSKEEGEGEDDESKRRLLGTERYDNAENMDHTGSWLNDEQKSKSSHRSPRDQYSSRDQEEQDRRGSRDPGDRSSDPGDRSRDKDGREAKNGMDVGKPSQPVIVAPVPVKEQHKTLQEELAKARTERRNLEIRREEMVKKAKHLQSKTQSRRNQARDMWKKRYFEEKKKTPPLEEKSNRLRIELESLHRKIVGQMEGVNQKSSKSDKAPLKPSRQNNLRINATKLNHEIEELQRRVDDSKMKLTGEVKLRNQAEAELRALRSELTQRKINVTLTRSQKLASMQDTPPAYQQSEMSPRL